jgi:hypothetical protein
MKIYPLTHCEACLPVIFVMLAGAMCAPGARAQIAAAFQYTGNPFNVEYCQSDQGLKGLNCGAGNVTALATFDLPSTTYTGVAYASSLVASGEGLTLNLGAAGSSQEFAFTDGVLTGASFVVGEEGVNYVASNPNGPSAGLPGNGSDYAYNGGTLTYGFTTSGTPLGKWSLVSRQTGGTPLQITTTTLPNASSGQAYRTMLAASGGSGTGYIWSLSSGSLPNGFNLASTGILSSTGRRLARPKSYMFTVQVSDSASNLATLSLTLVVQCAPAAPCGAIPVNFQQIDTKALPNGTLLLQYTWQSSDGNSADIADCKVGEFVIYPDYGSDGGTYIWPAPWYFSSPDPTSIWHSGSDLAFTDKLHYEPVETPYQSSLFDATQQFRFQCPSLAATTFSGWSGITIERSIEDTNPPNGCWTYSVFKYNVNQIYGTASARLPGVSQSACTN